MKNSVLFISMLVIGQGATAQVTVARSMKDLPVVNYETGSLRQGDSPALQRWMNKVAASELERINTLFAKGMIPERGNLKNSLTGNQYICDFILGNWASLQYADTLYRNQPQTYSAFRKEGQAELACYGRAKIEPGSDFDKTYCQIFFRSMDSLTEEEKEAYIPYILSGIDAYASSYDTELAEIKKKSSVADTSIYGALYGYVYRQLKNEFYHPIATYINTHVREKFTRADTLRGTVTPERAWWDVLHYSLSVKPDYASKTIAGSNVIRYEVVSEDNAGRMQIDLQDPLVIDSVVYHGNQKLAFVKDGNVWHVTARKQKKSSVDSIQVYYHGQVHEAINAPWDGGWVFTKDSLSNPWMSVACEGVGASLWFPCKDHLSDEPDQGATMSFIVPGDLIAVSNGRLISRQNNQDGTATFTWQVVSPINSYDITAYIGKYAELKDEYDGLKGKLSVDYWTLNYNLEKATTHMMPEVHRMLKAFEYWMGPYPFYEDGYKLVESPYAGMEHQSAVAYGNLYQEGYQGSDFSGSGWGLKWDYMIVHESGHEWFGNNITAKDIADMWVHEGFTMYSETLYTDYYYGKDAGNEYTVGNRRNIQNVFPIIGYYGVNDQVDSRNQDMYYKGSNLLQTIRHSMDDDTAFRKILVGLNQAFYHKTVTSAEVENYINQHAGFDYGKVFDQYLRNNAVPRFEFYFNKEKTKIFYRYANCISGFDLPLSLKNNKDKIRILPSQNWQNISITPGQQDLFSEDAIGNMYYIIALEIRDNEQIKDNK